MPYAAVTPNQLVDQLAERLGDQARKFWIDSELRGYLKEALRTYSVHAAIYSKRASIPTSPNVSLYDLFTIPDLAPTVTDHDIIVDIQRHIQEPVDPMAMASEQFSYVSMVKAIQNRRDKFLLETGLVLTVTSVSGISPSSDGVSLPVDTIDVRRAVFTDEDEISYILWRSDQLDLTAANPSWPNQPDIPQDYCLALELPLVMKLAPPPITGGTLSLLTVNSGAVLDPAVGPTILGIPDDLCWVVKFGALADMFGQEGPGMDKPRSQYCESRYRDGVNLARVTNFVKFGYNTGNPQMIDALSQMDNADPTWVSQLPGTPEFIGISGNVAAASPIPNNLPHSLGFDIMPKFVMPAPTQQVQIGAEVVDIILDYAQHLATLKEGMEEVTASIDMYKNLIDLCATQNDRLRAISKNFSIFQSRSNIDQHYVPRRQSDIAQTGVNYDQKNS